MNREIRGTTIRTRGDKTLYITDLDGTFLNSNHSVSKESIEILNPLLEKGLHFMVATARNYPSAHALLWGLSYTHPMILAGGALIATTGGKPLWTAEMDSVLIHKIYSSLEAFASACVWTSLKGGNRLLIYSGTGTGTGTGREKAGPSDLVVRFKDYRERNGFSAFAAFCGADDLMEAKIITLTLMVTLEEARVATEALIQDGLGTLLEIHTMPYPGLEGLYTMTVQPKTTHKGSAIRALLQLPLGFEHISRIVVFGDQLNDVGMFKEADVALAVSGAHPYLREIASQVVGSNDDHSVAKWIAEDAAKPWQEEEGKGYE